MRTRPRVPLISLMLAAAVVAGWMPAAAGSQANHPQAIGVSAPRADDGSTSGPWLGVSVEEETEQAEGGARVVWVMDDSPADEIGLRPGDVIISLEGKRIYGPRGLSEAIRDKQSGDSIEVEILRDGERQALTVELGARPSRWIVAVGKAGEAPRAVAVGPGSSDEPLEPLNEHRRHVEIAPFVPFGVGILGSRPKLGVQLTEVTPELREHWGGSPDSGVLVAKVLKGLPAEMAGIRVGDLIESVDGQTIEDAGDLVDALRGKDGETIRVDVVRDQRPLSIDVVLPDPRESSGSGGGPRA